MRSRYMRPRIAQNQWTGLEVVLVDRLEGMAEVELRDLAAQDDPGDGREAVVQPCPESSVDDLAAEVARRVEVPYRV
jgi:hypothetical protein